MKGLSRHPGRRPVRSARALVISALAAASLLAACTLEPRYRDPALPVPTQWPIPPTAPAVPAAAGTPAAALNEQAPRPGEGAVGGTRHAVDIGWREFFADPALQTLIAQALANNRDLRVAVLNVQLAHSQYVVQRASLFPQLNATGSYLKQHIPAAEFGFPITAAYFSAGAAISSFEADLFGRVRSLNHAALQRYFAQGEARRAAQLSLIAQVAQEYMTLLADRQQLKLAQDTLVSQQRSYDITELEHQRGQVSGLDVAQAESTVDTAKSNVALYEGHIAQDLDALQLLVGGPVGATRLPQALNDQLIGIPALPADLPSTVLLRRPDVLEAEHTLRAANADIGAARATFFPTISLTGNIGSIDPKLTGLFSSGTGSWSYSPQVSLPIFHGGSILGGLSEARVSRDIAVAQYEKSIQTAFREVADALALTGTLARERAAQEALVNATGRAYQLSEDRYRAGQESFLNVLDSQRSYYAAEQSLITTELAQQSNRVTLYTALGGGWRESSQ
jgi:multidrug efflux system outer membrane protein